MTNQAEASRQDGRRLRHRVPASIHVGLGYLAALCFYLVGFYLAIELIFGTGGLRQGFHLDYLIETILFLGLFVLYPIWAGIQGFGGEESKPTRIFGGLLLLVCLVDLVLFVFLMQATLPGIFGV